MNLRSWYSRYFVIYFLSRHHPLLYSVQCIFKMVHDMTTSFSKQITWNVKCYLTMTKVSVFDSLQTRETWKDIYDIIFHISHVFPEIIFSIFFSIPPTESPSLVKHDMTMQRPRVKIIVPTPHSSYNRGAVSHSSTLDAMLAWCGVITKVGEVLPKFYH